MSLSEVGIFDACATASIYKNSDMTKLEEKSNKFDIMFTQLNTKEYIMTK